MAFENAGVLGDDDDDDPNAPPGWMAGNSIEDPWFSPATDIVHLNWSAAYKANFSNTGNPIPFFLWAAAKDIAVSITADLVHGFDAPFRLEWARKDFDLLERRKDYLVTLKMVNLHVDMDQAAHSGLFGRLAEERVKLVDPADKETIQKYHQLWAAGPREDREPATFFELALSTESFQDRIEKWSDEVDAMWLRHKWVRAQDENFANIEDHEQIWLDPRRDESGEPVGVLAGPPGFHIPRYFPNKDHPWVRKVLEDMPRFSLMIMFRLCEEKCYMPTPPVPRSQRGRGLGGVSQGG